MIDIPQFFSYQGYTVKRQKLNRYFTTTKPQESPTSQLHTLKQGTTTSYAFSSFASKQWPEIINDTTSITHSPLRHHYQQETKKQNRHIVSQIAVGSTGSGLSWHRHDAAWNSIVLGRKLWFLSDPKHDPPPGLDSNHTGLSWFQKWYQIEIQSHNKNNQSNKDKKNNKKDRKQGHVQTCILNAQEILYIPKGWWHSTINLGDVISRSARRSKKPISRYLNVKTIIENIQQHIAPLLLIPKFQKIKRGNLLLKYINQIKIETLLDGDYMIALCENQFAYNEYKAAIERGDQLLKAAIASSIRIDKNVGFNLFLEPQTQLLLNAY